MNLRLVSSGDDHLLAIKDHLLPLLRECGTLEYERDVARLITSSATSIAQMPPLWHLGIDDAVELARAKRGVEPLRIVVMGQGHGVGLDPLMVTAGGGMLEPMPARFWSNTAAAAIIFMSPLSWTHAIYCIDHPPGVTRLDTLAGFCPHLWPYGAGMAVLGGKGGDHPMPPAERERVKAALLAYVKQHQIRVHDLADRMNAERKKVDPKTLHRFLERRLEIDDSIMGVYRGFVDGPTA